MATELDALSWRVTQPKSPVNTTIEIGEAVFSVPVNLARGDG